MIFVCCRLNYTQFPVCTTSIRDYYPQIPLHAVCSPLSITHRFLYTHIQPRTIGIIFTRRFHYTRFPLLTLSAFPFLSEICRLLKSRSTGYSVINNRLRKLNISHERHNLCYSNLQRLLSRNVTCDSENFVHIFGRNRSCSCLKWKVPDI